MRFLGDAAIGADLMILNTLYHKGEFGQKDDILDIVYKDTITGKKYIHTIEHPKIEAYIVKEEYRDYDHYPNFSKVDKCTKHIVSSKNRFLELGNVLGCGPKEAKISNLLFQADMDVENFYRMQFYLEYMKEGNKPLSIGFTDIESDVINFDRFAEPGEAPQNVISYFDSSSMTMYTLICTQDNIPKVPKESKNYEKYEMLRSKFKEQTENFISKLDDFKEELHRDFDESYGEIKYEILIFEDEISMHKAYWKIVDYCSNDYTLAWNAPYDVSNLVERLRELGLDPNEVIPTPTLKGRNVVWKEDKNHVIHKRKHSFVLYTQSTFFDHMVLYTGIRAGGGKIESAKLNAVAKKVLKDEKLDYSEASQFRYFPYTDFWKFIKYNIKDVLLEYGIEKKSKDMGYFYAVMTENALKEGEIFTSTAMSTNSIRIYAWNEHKSVMGQNKNSLFKAQLSPEEIKQKKKDKFAGAFVMNPAHCSDTGFMLLGQANKYIHEFCIDEDITSE